MSKIPAGFQRVTVDIPLKIYRKIKKDAKDNDRSFPKELARILSELLSQAHN